MRKTYRLGPAQRPWTHKSCARSTPVDVMTAGGERFLVAPYGEVNWVRNMRAAKKLTLTRRGHTKVFTTQEIHGDEAALALRTYIRSVPVTRAYFDVGVYFPRISSPSRRVNAPLRSASLGEHRAEYRGC
jgi:hypothetical protein